MVLVTAGSVKRAQMAAAREAYAAKGEAVDEAAVADGINEQMVLIQSVVDTCIPKLVSDDIPLLESLMADVFLGVKYQASPDERLREIIVEVCEERHLRPTDNFVGKVLQLYGVVNLNHGLMLVGPSGSGKTCAWTVLLEALKRYEDNAGVSYVIDPKAVTKDELYGFLDPTTHEWTDGIFTNILRTIVDNRLGELDKQQWVIFDGDVDPEWIENLNSVLDDNKLLTLPNGERLALPDCFRCIFEVQDLKFATQATVSRSGMVWFSADTLVMDDYFHCFLSELRGDPLVAGESAAATEAALETQRRIAAAVAPHFSSDGLVGSALNVAATFDHIVYFAPVRVLNALFAMMKNICGQVLRYDAEHEDFPCPRTRWSASPRGGCCTTSCGASWATARCGCGPR